MQDNTTYPHSELTEIILGCCFNVMNELGIGFLESVYKNALFIAIKEKGFTVETEKRFEVIFRGRKVGLYIADLIVGGSVIVELDKISYTHRNNYPVYLAACDPTYPVH